jgi:hypothetical protein
MATKQPSLGRTATRIVTFGEIVARVVPPGFGRFPGARRRHLHFVGPQPWNRRGNPHGRFTEEDVMAKKLVNPNSKTWVKIVRFAENRKKKMDLGKETD